MNEHFNIEWHDSGQEPQVAPNPAYPHGIDVIAASPGQAACSTRLPYPARRCGHYIVECQVCGLRAGVTTAGRPDDPRSLTVACRPMAGSA